MNRSSRICMHRTIVIALTSITPSLSAEPPVDAYKVLQETENAIVHIDSQLIVPKIAVTIDLATLYLKQGEKKQAEQLFRNSLKLVDEKLLPDGSEETDPDLFRFDISIARANGSNLPEALKTIELIRDDSLRDLCLERVANSLAKRNAIPSAEVVGNLISSEKVLLRSEVLSSIAISLARVGKYMKAYETVTRLDKMPVNDARDRQLILNRKFWTLHEISLAHAQRSNPKEALNIANSIESVPIRFSTICEIAKAQAEKGNRTAALQLLDQTMQLFSHDLTSKQAEKVAYLQAEFRDPDKAMQTTEEHLRGSSAGHSMLLASIAYTRLGKSQKSRASYESGLELIRSNLGDQDSQRLANIAIEEVRVNQLMRGLEVAQMIQNDLARESTMGQMTIELLKKNDNNNAMRVADLVKKSDFQKSLMYREMAVRLASSSQEKARMFFGKALNAANATSLEGGTRVIALYELGAAQQQTGFHSEAASTFAQAREDAQNYKDEAYTAQFFKDIAKAQALSGDPQGALTSAQSQSSPLLKATSLIGVVEGITESQSSN